MRTGLAPRKTDDVTLVQHMLTLGRTERRLAAESDHPFFVQVVRVVRPEPAARLDFGHGRADQLTADAFADTHTFAAPALAVPRQIPLVAVEVESLHSVNASNQSSLCVVLGRSVSSGIIPERSYGVRAVNCAGLDDPAGLRGLFGGGSASAVVDGCVATHMRGL